MAIDSIHHPPLGPTPVLQSHRNRGKLLLLPHMAGRNRYRGITIPWLRRLRGSALRVAGTFGLANGAGDIAEELYSHLEAHVDDNLRRGMTLAQARREARLALGGLQA